MFFFPNKLNLNQFYICFLIHFFRNCINFKTKRRKIFCFATKKAPKIATAATITALAAVIAVAAEAKQGKNETNSDFSNVSINHFLIIL